MDDLRHESESASRVFKNRMMEMTVQRSKKVDANKKIVLDIES